MSTTNIDSCPSSSALAAMHHYRWPAMTAIWIVATLPMCCLAWRLIPTLIARTSLAPASWYWLSLALNAAVLAALSLWLIRKELGDLHWPEVRRRIRLAAPKSPRTEAYSPWLMFRLLPYVVFFCLSLLVGACISGTIPLAFLTWPSYANPLELASRGNAGYWVWGGLVLGAWAANAGAEELLFRGVLLPRMKGRRIHWLRNAFWYALYHLHKPWAIPFRMIDACAIALPARRYRSLWMAVTIRGCEGLGIAALIWTGVSSAPLPPLSQELPDTYVANQTAPEVIAQGPLEALPAYNPNSGAMWQVELQSRDLSALDIRAASTALFAADFDSRTRWPVPSRLPQGFDPARIMELGKHPGPGIRRLH